MKLRIVTAFEMDLVVELEEEKDLTELVGMIENNQGWFICSNMAISKENILYLEIEMEKKKRVEKDGKVIRFPKQEETE